MKLYLQPKTRSLEIWDGPRSGTEGAVQFFKADEAHPISEFTSYLSDTLIDSTTADIYGNVSNHQEFDKTGINFNTRSLSTNPNASLFSSMFVSNKKNSVFHLKPLKNVIDQVRSVKSSAEIALMKVSADISCEAFIDVCLLIFDL